MPEILFYLKQKKAKSDTFPRIMGEGLTWAFAPAKAKRTHRLSNKAIVMSARGRPLLDRFLCLQNYVNHKSHYPQAGPSIGGRTYSSLRSFEEKSDTQNPILSDGVGFQSFI